MDLQCSAELKAFIADVRRRAEGGLYRRTNGQKLKLLIQINDALTFRDPSTHAKEQPERKKFRVPVLQAITGKELLHFEDGHPSQDMLDSKWHSILIEETNNGKADRIIREIARIIESQSDTEPYSLFPDTW